MTTATGYSTQHVPTQRVSIQTVDPVSGTATALTRYSTTVTVNTDYHVGAVHVTPAIGEQWFVRRVAGDWALDHKVTFNTTVQANVIANPTSGTYQIGSSGPDTGPLNLLGAQVNAMAPLRLFAGNSPLPDASTVDEGSLAYNGTVPVFSDGTSWVELSTTGSSGAYVKPVGGIPATDMTSAVQAELTAASTALQSIPNSSVGPTQLSATGTPGSTTFLRGDNAWAVPPGTVTSASVVSANGFAGSVATSTTTPAITISTSVTGLMVGNGTSVSGVTAPTGTVVGTTDTQTISGKTLTSPTINGYAEGVQALGTMGSTKTIGALSTGTVVWGTLTSATACTVTMPSAAAGISFMAVIRQPSSGTATTVTFTGVKWPGGTAPTITPTLGEADAFSFFCYDGTNWYGSPVQGYTY